MQARWGQLGYDNGELLLESASGSHKTVVDHEKFEVKTGQNTDIIVEKHGDIKVTTSQHTHVDIY